MKFSSLTILLSALLIVSLANGQEFGENPWETISEHVISPRPWFEMSELPDAFSWTNVDGKSFVTAPRNQHTPLKCGSCYACAATGAMSDRIKVARNGAWPDVNISPQHVLSCDDKRTDLGCYGGNPWDVYKFFFENGGAVDETCSPYEGRGYKAFDNPCTPERICSSCDSEGNCEQPKSYIRYKVKEYGVVTGEQAMKSEIYARGPIACGIGVNVKYHEYMEGVYSDPKTVSYGKHHVIMIVGWGVDDDGTPYWIERNSFSTYWGENGYMRLKLGEDTTNIETNYCGWVVPDTEFYRVDREDYPFDEEKATNAGGYHEVTAEDDALEANFFASDESIRSMLQDMEKIETAPFNSQKMERAAEAVGHTSCSKKVEFTRGEMIKSPLPHETVIASDLPANFFWGNQNGQNYLSWNINQNSPAYCASCWALATTSALADRLNILNDNVFPRHTLAPQVAINCNIGGGSCTGGDPASVYYFMNEHGIPDHTCQHYNAVNPASFDCSPVQVCQDCNGDVQDDCSILPSPKLYYVSEYGTVSGVDQMKAEIHTRGPIACGMQSTTLFQAYTGGVYREEKVDPVVNHEVSIVGWGTENTNGEDYWIVRNSWGTTWGNYGYFKILMGHPNLNLGIETSCSWGVPTETKP